MLNIAVVTPHFPTREQPYRGHSVYQSMLRLQKWSNLTVICPLATYPSWFPPRNFPYSKTDLSYSPPSLHSRYFEYPAIPGVTRAINGIVCARYLERELSQVSADVILNYWIYPEGYAATVVGRKLGIPVIVGAVGSDLNRIPESITRWQVRRTIRQASFTITVSEHLRQQAIRLGAKPKRSRAILNGCDPTVFYPSDRKECCRKLGVAPECDLIVYVGRLDVKKGLRELIDAMALLGDLRHLRLMLVGSGSAGDELKARARERGVADRITFTGMRDSCQVADHIKAADVLCLPSYAEGCPNVVIESLSCGRPVVATDVGGIPELIDESCGILVPPHSAFLLANGLRLALTRPWNQCDIASRRRRTWEDVALEIYRVCEAVVKESVVGVAKRAGVSSSDNSLIQGFSER